jgi:hypothetical protein
LNQLKRISWCNFLKDLSNKRRRKIENRERKRNLAWEFHYQKRNDGNCFSFNVIGIENVWCLFARENRQNFPQFSPTKLPIRKIPHHSNAKAKTNTKFLMTRKKMENLENSILIIHIKLLIKITQCFHLFKKKKLRKRFFHFRIVAMK